MNLKEFDKQLKEQASASDWIVVALYLAWICVAQTNLIITNAKLFYPLLIPDIIYVAVLCFVLFKRKQQNKDAWVVAHTLLLILTIILIAIHWWVYITAAQLT